MKKCHSAAKELWVKRVEKCVAAARSKVVCAGVWNLSKWQILARSFLEMFSLAHSSENISLLHLTGKKGWAGKEEVGCKIAKVFETCQRGANISWGKKLEAKKRGRVWEAERWRSKSAKLFESCGASNWQASTRQRRCEEAETTLECLSKNIEFSKTLRRFIWTLLVHSRNFCLFVSFYFYPWNKIVLQISQIDLILLRLYLATKTCKHCQKHNGPRIQGLKFELPL